MLLIMNSLGEWTHTQSDKVILRNQVCTSHIVPGLIKHSLAYLQGLIPTLAGIN